jgi:hypothetical protein
MPTRTAVGYRTDPLQALPDLDLAQTIEERDPQERPGLRDALSMIAAARADTLALARLADVARSLDELLRLFDWLEESEASLACTEPPLDTATSAGQASAQLLREIQRWEREPSAPRRPRGRPGLATGSPELARRIAQMRARGLTLQAIADELNRTGVPTPRGGAGWRPSSVQSALGYRRPRPPVPGAPPPGRPPSPHPGPLHRRPRKAPKPPAP